MKSRVHGRKEVSLVKAEASTEKSDGGWGPWWGTLRKKKEESYWNWRMWVSVHTNILTERVETLRERPCQSICPYDSEDSPASGLSSFSGLKVLKLLKGLFIYMFQLYVSENGMHLLTHPGLPGPESGFLLGCAVLAPLPSFWPTHRAEEHWCDAPTPQNDGRKLTIERNSRWTPKVFKNYGDLL